MKPIYLLLILVLLFDLSYSQPGFGRRRIEDRKKIEELKKIKLIETLDLSEEEAIRFFTIYNDHQKKIFSLQEDRDKLIDQLERLTRTESRINEVKLRELFNKLEEIERKIFKARQEFHTNIQNAISSEKFAKYIVFEREFARELSKLIMWKRQGNQ